MEADTQEFTISKGYTKSTVYVTKHELDEIMKKPREERTSVE